MSVMLEVPDSMAETPFDTERQLTVPSGFGVRLWARVEQARFMALASNGDVLVSNPSAGTITLLRPDAAQAAAEPERFTFASGLQRPHDMVFHRIGDTLYLYVAESHRVTRSVYQVGDTESGVRETIVADLPDASNTELQGSYQHQLKNIALSSDDKLYVAIASSCNACAEDLNSDPVRAAFYEYNADGSDARLHAQGLRNAEGLDFLPNGQLWVTVNSRDELRYPLDEDITGDGQSDLGVVIPTFVDDNPPDLFTSIQAGADYGWPYCNPMSNASMQNLALMRDHDLNREGKTRDCATIQRADKGILAHAAPLGFSFLHDTAVPAPWRQGAAVALHGCWNCTTLRAGYKVVYFPFDASGKAGKEIDLLSGFVTDPAARTFWGRPVDVIADAQGNFLVSDDYAGAIYQIYLQ